MYKIYVTVTELDSNGMSKKSICEQCVIPSENMAHLKIGELGDLTYGITINGAKTISESAALASKKYA